MIDSGKRMIEAALAFIESLNEDQRSLTVLNFSDQSERENWHYIPRDRKGLAFNDMEPLQIELAKSLLKCGVSVGGYEKIKTIISLETILGQMEAVPRRFPRDPGLYYLTIFDLPSEDSSWGWRFEGHHISINHTLMGNEFVGQTPLFFGSNPAKVLHGDREGLRALKDEEDLGRQLLHELDGSQEKLAIISVEAPSDILTTNTPFVTNEVVPQGLCAIEMSESQREVLAALIDVYIGRLPEECAEETRSNLARAGLNSLYFCWAGSGEPGDPHYYRLQSEQYMAEYDNTQNDANHIHAVWRDLKNDFGQDALRGHLLRSHK